MKVSKPILFYLMVPLSGLLLNRCDTSGTVDSPAKSYFVKYMGDEGDQTGVDFEVNPDGTFILLGTTRKQDSTSQLYVVKADAGGNVVWEQTFGGPLDDEARDVEIASDGRIIILGNTYVSGSGTLGGSRDILITSLNPDGTKINSRTLSYFKKGSGEPADDDATSLTQTNDGFIVAGSTDNIKHALNPAEFVYSRLALIARLNDDLTTYPAPWPDPPAIGQSAESITTKLYQLADGSFYGFGSSKWNLAAQTDFNFWYFSLGQGGGEPTDARAFGAPSIDEKLSSVAFVPDLLGGGFFLGGIISNQSGDDDVYFTRLRNPLDFQPTDPNFGPAPLGYNLGKLKSEVVNVTVSNTFGYYVLVNETSTGNNNLFLMKVDPDGKKLWSSPVIYGGQGDDFVGAVRELPDGKILVFGTMVIGQQPGESKMVLIKVNQDGQFSE